MAFPLFRPGLVRLATAGCLTVMFGLVSAAAAAAEPQAKSPAAAEVPAKAKPAAGLVYVVKEHAGQQTLMINYLWKVHDRPSVEVKMAASDQAGAMASPQYFVGDYFKGAESAKVYRCLDKASDQGATDSFIKDKTEFKIIGQRNSLGRPSVVVLPFAEGTNPTKRPAAVFPLLDGWAINDRLLALDLPHDVFAKKGTLFVWFLRGEKVVWEEKIAWPGY